MTTETMTPQALDFAGLNLSKLTLKAIADMGFSSPSSIQAEAIPQILQGNDIIAKAPTGSGKTAAFAIPLLEKLDNNEENKSIQALVLCPTRELAIQVHKEFEKLTKYQENIQVVSVYGGQQIDKQLFALKRKPQIVVATPGRLMDHIRRGSIKLDAISMVVLDEADEMLDMGFREDIHTILKDTPENRQTILFSATMAKDIMELTKKFQKYPNIVDVSDNLQNTPNIEQQYFEVVEKDKIELLTRLLDLHSVNLGLVFCNTKSNVDKVVEILKTRGYLSDSLHGDMNQAQREKVMRGFRNGGVEILVATDVAGRGIDIKNIQAVFNYDLPRDDEDYIHRIGRTARAGKSGIAFSFVSRREVQHIRRIERANGIRINKTEAPSFEAIEIARTSSYENKIKSIITNDDLSEYISKIESMVSDEVSVVEIAASLLKMSMKKASKRIDKTVVFEAPRDEEGSRSRRRGGSNHGARFGRDNKYGRNNNKSDRDGNYSRGERNFGSKDENFSKKERSYGDKPNFSKRKNSSDVNNKKNTPFLSVDEMLQSVTSIKKKSKKNDRFSGKSSNKNSKY